MRFIVYLIFVSLLAGLAWQYPFLFELPVIGALAGAYWLFVRDQGS